MEGYGGMGRELLKNKFFFFLGVLNYVGEIICLDEIISE